MFSNIEPIIVVIISVQIVWTVLLTIITLKIKKTFDCLINIGKNENLSKVLENLLEYNRKVFERVNDLEQKHLEVLKKERIHIQKIGLLRFNPFNDTGGDQSFALSLLDENDTGVVLSVLNGRTGTRIYSKPVKNGHEAEYELSLEEKKAVQKAINAATV